MSEADLEQMGRQELAHYMVAHRDTPEGEEARRVYIRRLLAKAKAQGIDLSRPSKGGAK